MTGEGKPGKKDSNKEKSIKADTCPYAFPEWNFKGKKYTNMKAVEATAEQLEADGACDLILDSLHAIRSDE